MKMMDIVYASVNATKEDLEVDAEVFADKILRFIRAADPKYFSYYADPRKCAFIRNFTGTVDDFILVGVGKNFRKNFKRALTKWCFIVMDDINLPEDYVIDDTRPICTCWLELEYGMNSDLHLRFYDPSDRENKTYSGLDIILEDESVYAKDDND